MPNLSWSGVGDEACLTTIQFRTKCVKSGGDYKWKYGKPFCDKRKLVYQKY